VPAMCRSEGAENRLSVDYSDHHGSVGLSLQAPASVFVQSRRPSLCIA